MGRDKMTGGKYSVAGAAGNNDINDVAAMGCVDQTEEANVSLNRPIASDIMY